MTGFCEERVRDGKASVFCLLLLEAEASLREASKERMEARFLMIPLLHPTLKVNFVKKLDVIKMLQPTSF